ncbi:MAG: sulfur carrier protein ThiS [Acidobacteriota bacterium]
MSDAAATVRVNGRDEPLEPGTRLDVFLSQLGLDAQRVAVERNREVVPRSQHGEVTLEPGDVLEIVAFVGGG